MKDYHINTFFSEEHEGYIADLPDLECCSAFGATPEEALQEVERAKRAWLEAARENGKSAVPAGDIRSNPVENLPIAFDCYPAPAFVAW